ncbi:hypothetical protein [Spirillospora sp. CA-294931]|uniref:hypothetical protein n=1 Tax=Spirillospora sp. CA-294931 TaxID=3240042 RepID=UPI003D90EA90
MRRAMSYVAPWVGVTALAVMLSWLGVREVVKNAISDRSTSAPISGPVIHESPVPPGSGQATEGFPPGRTPPGKRSPSGREYTPPRNMRVYSTQGGRATLAITEGRVRLITATPNPGFETYDNDKTAAGWLRVDFKGAEHTSTVIATWSERTPRVQIYEY